MEIFLFNSVFEFHDATLVDWLTWGVLTLTLIVLFIYTYYTFKLQKITKNQTNEIIKQRRLSIMPSLIHDITTKNMVPVLENFSVRNIGNGPAINISIDKIWFRHSIQRNKDVYAKIKSIGCLLPNEEKVEVFECYTNNDAYVGNSDKAQNLLNSIKRDGIYNGLIKITFKFQDIEGNYYKQENTLDIEGYHHGITEPITARKFQ